ncbi:MAG: hypothetical protein ACREQ8_12705 [Woeseiaceae bacterium]
MKVLGWFELGVGTILLAYACFLSIVKDGRQVIFPETMSGFAPFLLTFTGAAFAIASAPLISSHRSPMVMQIPLILWLAILWLALL